MAKTDMSRKKELAGQIVSQGDRNVRYDDLGYAVSASNYKHDVYQGTDRGYAAPNIEAVAGGSIDRASLGGSAYDQAHFSDNELQMAANARAAAAASGDYSAAHDLVEKLRSKYGYSGGDDGSDYVKLATSTWGDDSGSSGRSSGNTRWDGGGGLGGSFSYDGAPSYVNRYQSQIDDLTAQLLGREAFNYNYATDPLYQQYKESYTEGGQRAMQETLGQMAARTGGLASSYAGAASQQAYNNYMSGLADKIPELYQLAYSMYMDDIDRDRANLSMLMGLEQNDYGKYTDQLAQYNTDKNFSYNAYRDSVADQQYADDLAYSRELDAWERANYASEQQYDQALQRAQMLASIGDYSGYAALGYSPDDISKLETAYQAAQMLGRGTGGGDDGGSDAGIIDTMLGLGDDIRAYEYLVGLGKSTAITEKLWEMYEGAKGSVEGDSIAVEAIDPKLDVSVNRETGAFRWNGKTYSGMEALISDIEAADLSDEEKRALEKEFSVYGYHLSFD